MNIKAHTFFPLLLEHKVKNKNSFYTITVPQEVREVTGIDDEFKKLKKGKKLRLKVIISLPGEDE